MPTSPTHQNFLLLFRRHPELTFELARRAGAPLPRAYQRFEEVSGEFDDPLQPGSSVRADLAMLGHLRQGKRRGLVLEVQLDIDLNKEWTLLLYRTGLRRRYKCPAWAVLFSPEANVRTSVIDRMFEHEPELRPFVITPKLIPIGQDLQAALDNYAWAVLSAAVHATGPHAVVTATVAIRALLRIAPEDYQRYIQLVSASVGETIMQQVRDQLPEDEQIELTDFERRGSTYARAHREGFREGLEQGLQGLRAALRTVLEARELAIDEPIQQRIAACSSADELRELIVRAATITSTAELFPSS